MMRLIFHTGSRAGAELNTTAPVIRMGRDPASNDIVLDDPEVSARHCILTRSPRGAYVLEDLGSSNGTFVNEHRIAGVGAQASVFLGAGDRFRIGATQMEVGEGQPRLMVIAGPGVGRDFPIGEDPVTFGRAPDNTFEFDDPEVSAYHAAILCLPEGFVLQDNRSTNGTFLNEHRIEREVLTDGDTIRCGGNELRFLIEEAEAPAGAAAVSTLIPGDETAAYLVFVAGPHEGISVPLGTEQVFFGRREDCTFSVNDIQVSGTHCAVTRVANDYKVTDLQSTNGTFINGNRLTETTTLEPGDLLEFGECVIEFRLAGGVTTVDAPTAFTTVFADGAYLSTSNPKFLLDGHVISANAIILGSSPSSDFLVNGEGVSPQHCRIAWQDDGFYIEDTSRYGTYISDRRIVREKLQSGHVLRLGQVLISVTIRGERCTLETVDAAAAMAAIEVARENASQIAESVPDIAGAGANYQTVFKLELPDTEALVRERKAKFKEGAPAWRPSTDIIGDSIGKIAVISAAAAAAVIAGFLYTTERADALINHPLSEVHSSARFAEKADSLGLEADCTACHTAGKGVSDDNCVRCHDGFEGSVRALHLEPSENKKPHQESPGGDCQSCHTEHRGQERLDADGTKTLLGAAGTCSAESCHPNQHSDDFLREGTPLPLTLKAGPVPTFNLPQEEFHVRHALVTPKGSDEATAVGCTSCHARKADGGLAEGSAGKSCFGCHEGGEEFVNSQCYSCHRDEHQGVTRSEPVPEDDPSMAPVIAKPTMAASLLKGGALALAAFLPLLGVGLIRRMRRRKMAERVVEEIAQLPTEVVKRLVHSINHDKCVGCQMCVQACPASVLELVQHKSVVVNFDACIQCRKCEQACAFDALRMHEADKPPPMIQMPEVDRYYQTQVEGMYLIGQAAGTPQIKNASNLGRACIQQMVKGGFAPGTGPASGAQVDVIIVGSGPAGLSAALSCAQLGLTYHLLEKQRDFSWTIRNYYHKGKPVMAEPHDVEMIGLLPHWDTNREELLGAWEQSIQQYGIDVKYQQDVTSVKRDGPLFRVGTSDNNGNPLVEYTAARVVLAIGTMGNPRKLGCPGDDLEKVFNALVDPDEYRGRNILIVGGTDSAIEVVMALREHNNVWLSCRGSKFDRVKPKNLQLIEETFEKGQCTPLFATKVAEVRPDAVVLEYKEDGRKEEIPNDVVFAMIGGHPPIKWLQSIGVGYTEKPHSWSPARTDDLARETQ